MHSARQFSAGVSCSPPAHRHSVPARSAMAPAPALAAAMPLFTSTAYSAAGGSASPAPGPRLRQNAARHTEVASNSIKIPSIYQ